MAIFHSYVKLPWGKSIAIPLCKASGPFSSQLPGTGIPPQAPSSKSGFSKPGRNRSSGHVTCGNDWQWACCEECTKTWGSCVFWSHSLSLSLTIKHSLVHSLFKHFFRIVYQNNKKLFACVWLCLRIGYVTPTALRTGNHLSPSDEPQLHHLFFIQSPEKGVCHMPDFLDDSPGMWENTPNHSTRGSREKPRGKGLSCGFFT